MQSKKTGGGGLEKQTERGGKKVKDCLVTFKNEENGRYENTVLSTWRWCKQGWPRLSQTTDRWPRSRSLLLTLLKKYLFNLIKIFKKVQQ